MNFRKFRKSAKALSPVIATIILIAVTVAVSVVVAAWMGALTIGFMGNSEQASITNAQLYNSADKFSNDTTVGATEAVVTVQNTGSATVTIKSGSVDGAAWTLTTSVSIAKGQTGIVIITNPASATTYFTNTAQYTVTLQTSKGNSLPTQATYTGSS